MPAQNVSFAGVRAGGGDWTAGYFLRLVGGGDGGRHHPLVGCGGDGGGVGRCHQAAGYHSQWPATAAAKPTNFFLL